MNTVQLAQLQDLAWCVQFVSARMPAADPASVTALLEQLASRDATGAVRYYRVYATLADLALVPGSAVASQKALNVYESYEVVDPLLLRAEYMSMQARQDTAAEELLAPTGAGSGIGIVMQHLGILG